MDDIDEEETKSSTSELSPRYNFRTKLAAYKYETPSSSPSKALLTRSRSLTSAESQAHAQNTSRKRQLPSSPDPDDELPTLASAPRKRRQGAARRERSDSSTPRRYKKPSRSYAPPETYSHLHMLPDYMGEYLDIMFCGINPGVKSATNGHHYAHATNHFWESLYQSKLTNRRLTAEEDYTLPEAYNYGLTNLVDRPSAEQSELSKAEMKSSVCELVNKVVKYRPRIVCFLAKSVWEIFIGELYRSAHPSASPVTPSPSLVKATRSMRSSHFFADAGGPSGAEAHVIALAPEGEKSGKAKRSRSAIPSHDFNWGLQPFKLIHRQLRTESPVSATLFFVVPSPSARVVAYQLQDKVKFLETLKTCVEDVKAARVDLASMHSVPYEHATSKSVYWLIPDGE